MKVKALFFASLREVVGKGIVEFEVDQDTTVGVFKELIGQRYPGLKKYFSSVTLAVNTEYAGFEEKLKEGDEVAFVPPISGG